MTLKIKVVGRYAKSFKDNGEKAFTVHGGTLGRAVDNDWILPDPHRHISSKHAAIQHKDGHYFLVDTSTNGVFVNKSKVRIGRGNSVVLRDGDTFRISDFVFEVSLREEKQGSRRDRDPASMSLSEKDDMISYSALLEADEESKKEQARIEARQRESDFADEFLTETIAPDSLDEKIEGWDMMEMPDSKIEIPPSPLPREPDQSVELLPPEDIRSHEELDLSLADEDLDELTGEKPNPRLTLVEDFPGSESTITEEDTPEINPAPARQAAKTPPPDKAKSVSDSGAHRGDPVLIFLQAAGIDIHNIRPQDSAQIMQNAGQLLREFVVGAMDTLVIRSEIKNSLRVSQTAIQPGEYNPLRFSAGVDESLRALLLEKTRRGMSPVDAVRQSFNDLRVHQLALVGAMKEAVDSLFSRFDPADLEDRFDRGMKRGPIMGKTNKLKYWELFTDLYNAMAEGRTGGVPRIFMDEFSRAYEEKAKQVRKVKPDPDSKAG
jgi:type VI secretion system protein